MTSSHGVVKYTNLVGESESFDVWGVALVASIPAKATQLCTCCGSVKEEVTGEGDSAFWMGNGLDASWWCTRCNLDLCDCDLVRAGLG